MTKLRCAKCRKIDEFHKEACLGVLNSVMNKYCYSLEHAFKDFEVFRYNVDKYDIFEKLR